MKSRARKRIGLVLATAVFLGLSGTCALAIVNPNNAILNGTYKAVGQDAGFSQGEGWLNANLSGDSGTLTFDGAGSCTATFGGSSFGLPLGIQNPSVNVYTNNDPTIDCTYDINSDGSVSLTHPEGDGTATETFWTNPAGTVILGGGAEERPGDQAGTYEYETNQFVVVKTGAAVPQGTFHAVSQDAGFWGSQGGGVTPSLYGNGVTLNFNGTGGCSFSLTGSDYWVNYDGSIGVSPESQSGTCTYKTASDGLITVTLPNQETFSFQLSSNGNVILQGGAQTDTSDPNNTGYEVTQMVAVKAGSTMTRASLQGLFHMVSQDANFWGSTYGASVNLYGNKGTLSFDGAGICSYAFEGGDYGVSLGEQYPSINPSANSDSGPCTYAVALNGAVTLTHAEGTEKFWLSADGTTLISGGAKKRIETDGTGYEVNQMVGVKINPYVGTVSGSVSVTVPEVDPDGNYTISWAPADTPKVTYVLEEAKDPDFLTGLRSAYRGLNLSASITYRPKGQSYYYRLRSERTGYAPSDWLVAGNPCNVGTPLLPASITVPVSDADGSYTISWKASLTPGVTYVVEEAIDSLFVNIVATYIGSETAWGRDNPTGTTYFYRVKVQKDGFAPAESGWKKALNPCKVGLLPPTAFTVPPSAGTSYTISWDPSLTAGITYNLQEATDKAFTLGLRNVTLPAPDATDVTISGRKVGKTYYYRLRAVKPNYAATPWLKSANGCLVGPDAPK